MEKLNTGGIDLPNGYNYFNEERSSIADPVSGSTRATGLDLLVGFAGWDVTVSIEQRVETWDRADLVDYRQAAETLRRIADAIDAGKVRL
jgi:hypothetical protein